MAGMFTVFIGVIVVQAYTLVKTHPAGQPQSVHFLVSSPSFKVLRRGGCTLSSLAHTFGAQVLSIGGLASLGAFLSLSVHTVGAP